MNNFKTTKNCGGYLKIDENNYLFKIPKSSLFFEPIYSFSDLLDFEAIEDNQTITKGGISMGRAIVGTVLVGGVGTVMGGLTGKKKQDDFCNKLEIRLSLKNGETKYIKFITSKTKRKSILYKMALKEMNSCITLLNIISSTYPIEQINTKNYIDQYNQTADNPKDVAEELKLAKTMLDLGAITQEEFDKKLKESREFLGLK